MSGASAPAIPGPPLKFEQAPITNISQILNSTDAESFWTRTVNLSNVTVQQIFRHEQFVMVGPDPDHTLVVQLSRSRPGLKPGEKISVAGIIDPLGKDKSQWNVPAPEEKILKQHQIFIREAANGSAKDNR
jgi:hypothetical protein